MKVETIADVVLELNKYYHEALVNLAKKGKLQKEERGELFLKIFQILFEKYGEYLGFKNLSDFKSEVMFAKNQQKTKKTNKYFAKKKDLKINIERVYPYRFKEKINEGSGQAFTLKQIRELGLNEDSY